MFGTPLYAILFYGLPGWNQLHTAFRWIFPWTLGIAFLAGLGAQFIADGISKRALAILGLALAGIGSLTVFGVVLSWAMGESFLQFADAFVNASDLAKPVFETGRAFWSYQARNFVLFGAFALLAGMVFLLARANVKVRGVADAWQALSEYSAVAGLRKDGMAVKKAKPGSLPT